MVNVSSAGRPSVDVIIVNYNGRLILKSCLDALMKTTYPNFRVVVVDNNSNDGSVEFLRTNFSQCTIIQLDSNKGFAKANNLAAKNSESKYLAFLNNDTIVTPNWLDELVRNIEETDSVQILQSLLLRMNQTADSSGDFATVRGLTYNSRKIGFTEPRMILSARGAAMLVRRSYFIEIGGFDEDYFISFEDVEFGWKAWILGYKVIMVPSSIVYHLSSYTTSQMDELMTFHGLKNQLSLVSTHFEKGRAVSNIVWMFASLILRFLTLTLLGRRTTISKVSRKAAIKAILWYFSNLGLIYKKHKELNKRRKRSTNELIQLGLLTENIQEQ